MPGTSSQPPDHGLPEGVDPLGVPRDRSGRETFIITLAIVVAVLALTFTLGWVVYHQLVTDNPPTIG